MSTSKNGYSLEPISEEDLDLASRFGAQKKEISSTDSQKTEKQSTQRVEGIVERSTSERDAAYQKQLRAIQDDDEIDVSESSIAQDASDVHQHTARESQIQHLLDLALTKSPSYAVKVAEHTDDYYILDKVHDRLLTEEFRKALAERGL